MKDSERQVADLFISALKSGAVQALPAYPDAKWKRGSDPPDLVVSLDASAPVSVELATLMDRSQHYQKDMVHMLKEAEPGRPSLMTWSAHLDDDIRSLVTQKNDKYRKHPIGVDWLLLHQSYDLIHGYFEGDLSTHRYLGERLHDFFAGTIFSKVLLHSSQRGHEYWSVIYSRDGFQIATLAEHCRDQWRARFADDARVTVSGITVVETTCSRPPSIPPEPLVNVSFNSPDDVVCVIAVFSGRCQRVFRAPSPTPISWWQGWLPCASESTAVDVATELAAAHGLPRQSSPASF